MLVGGYTEDMNDRFNRPTARRVHTLLVQASQVPGDASLLLRVVEVPPAQSPPIPENEGPAHVFLLPRAVAEDLHTQLGLVLVGSAD